MSNKGVRDFAKATFLANLGLLKEKGGKAFRRVVLDTIVAEMKVSMNSASTHYNHAFKAQKAADPASVEGLGRPEGKNNGGRKPTHLFNVVKEKNDEVVAANVSKAKGQAMVDAAAAAKKAKLKLVEVPKAEAPAEAPVAEGQAAEQTPEQTSEAPAEQAQEQATA